MDQENASLVDWLKVMKCVIVNVGHFDEVCDLKTAGRRWN